MPDTPGTVLMRIDAVGSDAETIKRRVRYDEGWLIYILFGEPWLLPHGDQLWRVMH